MTDAATAKSSHPHLAHSATFAYRRFLRILDGGEPFRALEHALLPLALSCEPTGPLIGIASRDRHDMPPNDVYVDANLTTISFKHISASEMNFWHRLRKNAANEFTANPYHRRLVHGWYTWYTRFPIKSPQDGCHLIRSYGRNRPLGTILKFRSRPARSGPRGSLPADHCVPGIRTPGDCPLTTFDHSLTPPARAQPHTDAPVRVMRSRSKSISCEEMSAIGSSRHSWCAIDGE